MEKRNTFTILQYKNGIISLKLEIFVNFAKRFRQVEKKTITLTTTDHKKVIDQRMKLK